MYFYRRKRWAWKIQDVLILASLAGLTCLLGACQMQSSAAGGGGNHRQPVAASISFCDDAVAGCPAATGFSVETARDIVIQVTWINVPEGNHVQTLALSMPGGGLYQQTQSSFAIDAGASGTVTLKRILPVAATWIQQRSITGKWNVDAALDGQPVTSEMLEINP